MQPLNPIRRRRLNCNPVKLSVGCARAGLRQGFCGAIILAWASVLSIPSVRANPTGGVAAQGSASFNTSGSTLTVQTSDRAFINWQRFNIGVGETTTFLQPSSSSIVWNRIDDPNPSQILGNLNANGYVVLQNPSGFFIGGSAAITTHGLLMTTAPIPMPDLSSGGPWQFNTLPPTASIINYGSITLDKGGSVFLIAHRIENHGSITAPEGNVGLAAGQEVLVSARPDGRGLSARVTLPEGSVDNSGNVIADAGSIAMHAQVVNQGGLVQANAVQNLNGIIELVASGTLTVSPNATVSASAGSIALHASVINQNGTVQADSVGNINGTIELVADDALHLGATSILSVRGDSTATSPSPGGFVVLKAGNSFADTAASAITVSGTQGGQSGIIELLCDAVDVSALHSRLDDHFALLINPYDLTLSQAPSDLFSSSPILNLSDLSSYAHLNLHAADNIELSSLWTLPNPGAAAGLGLTAGNSILLDNGAAVKAAANWSVNLTAGVKQSSGGIYLNGNSFLETQDGNISLWAANEVLVNTGDGDPVGDNGIRTLAGGSISVKTLLGNVNTGGNTKGFRYRSTAPFYSVLTTLGGISTAAGGDVTIDAGGDVISYLPSGSDPNVAGDGGSGAFGPQAGNVTILAGGGVYGHFVAVNGVGTISAGQNVGGPDASQNVALSLVKGSWTLNAPNGNIYLQEVRNPNGVFNNGANNPNSAGYHFFDYDPHASLALIAGLGVYLTGLGLPRTTDPAPPMIFPPSLEISAGSGGITLQDTVILFPSASGDLHITDGGSFQGIPNNPQLNPTPALIMSDSSQTRWVDSDTFGLRDHGAVPAQLANPDPATIDVAGNMKNLILMTSKQTRITVGGDLVGSSFSGQNLHAGDVTSIEVTGRILNQSPYSFVFLDQAIPLLPAANQPPNTRASWDSIFGLAVNPDTLAQLLVPPNQTPAQLAALLGSAALFPTRPAFSYNATTKRLTFSGSLTDAVKAALENPLTVVHYGADGLPQVANGHFVTDTVSWGVALAKLDELSLGSQGAPSAGDAAGLGYVVGGPGQFNVHAGSISLGNTYGILTTGVGDPQGNHRFANLAPYTPSGATLHVAVDGNLEMSASTIAALGGGDVNVVSTGGAMNLGSQDLADFQRDIIKAHGFALGIYSSSLGNVNVTALGDINIDSSRIASYNGGNISVRSLQGNVNAGNGNAILTPVVTYYVDPASGAASEFRESVYGSGILATTLSEPSRVPGSPHLPGNISVATPRGNIVADQGGILQTVLNGTLAPGPTITLVAGTRPSGGAPGYAGNIDLGNSGVIGGAVNLDANGNISGLIISRQDSTINAAQSFNGTVLAGGTANLSAGGSVAGTIIGISGVNASGGAGVSATVLGQNVSVNGGQAESTLGTTATTTSASQSASQQATSDARQQVASDKPIEDEDKKKKGKRPVVTRRSRVTVILPKTS